MIRRNSTFISPTNVKFNYSTKKIKSLTNHKALVLLNGYLVVDMYSTKWWIIVCRCLRNDFQSYKTGEKGTAVDN